MDGIRAFGRNEGGLNHTGDFPLLFSPLLPELSNLAVFGVVPGGETLHFPFLFDSDDYDKAEELIDTIWNRLDTLDMCPERRTETGAMYPRYFRPGFFPDCAAYIRDDWNSLLCFDEPYPEYKMVSQARRRDDPVEMVATGFQFFFRNIDACWWEVFSPRRQSMELLTDYLCRERVDHQLLQFERDYPDSSTPVERTFRDVHTIWPPEKQKG